MTLHVAYYQKKQKRLKSHITFFFVKLTCITESRVSRPFAVNFSVHLVKNLEWQQIFSIIKLNSNQTIFLQKFSSYFSAVFL